MKNLFIVLIGSVLFFSCKKNDDTPIETIGEINIDVQNNDFAFKLEKVHYLTDSIYFSFRTIDSNYNCDKYRINMATERIGNTINITLGNIYRDGGFCIYGFFPATNTYKTAALALGNYKLKVKNSTKTFEGLLQVTSNSYTINWEHDDHVMKIKPKVLQK